MGSSRSGVWVLFWSSGKLQFDFSSIESLNTCYHGGQSLFEAVLVFVSYLIVLTRLVSFTKRIKGNSRKSKTKTELIQSFVRLELWHSRRIAKLVRLYSLDWLRIYILRITQILTIFDAQCLMSQHLETHTWLVLFLIRMHTPR